MRIHRGVLPFSIFLFTILPSMGRVPPGPAWTQLTNDDCRICHGDTTATRADGSSVYVDPDVLSKSIHGRLEVECVHCHADLQSLDEPPHEANLARPQCASCHEEAQRKYDEGIHALKRQAGSEEAASCSDCHGSHDVAPKSDPASRVNPMNLPDTCGTCHSRTVRAEAARGGQAESRNIFDLYSQSVHARVLRQSGLTVTGICSTCHGYHDIYRGDHPKSTVYRANIPVLCGKCHGGIYNQFVRSVHGQDFLTGVQDVPVCTDCHGEHSIQGPREAESTVSAGHVAATCSRCHEDMQLARTYGLLVGRMSTYLGTYHGIAMNLGMTTVANCASCHGVHDILPSSEPDSTIHPNNLSTTCGHCHLGAGENFAHVKIHQLDVRQDNVWAYWIKRFYVSMIGAILGTFGLFIFADLFGRARRYSRSKVSL